MDIVYPGRVKDGILKVVHRDRFDRDIKFFEGKDVVITVSKKKKKRSLNQNNFHWGVIIPILKEAFYEAGSLYTKEQIHDILRDMFLKVDEPVGKDGLFVTRTKSSTELTTTEWMDWNLQITIWAAEFFGITIPEPNEQTQI